MRPIEFRAWDRKNTCWHEGGRICDIKKSNDLVGFMFDRDGWALPPEAEWVQYTGLKDKNGVKIFEGDIVHGGGDIRNIAEVYFSTEHSFGSFLLRNGWTQDMMWNKEELEVIGNIYEHPHLLKDQKNGREL